MRKYIVGACAVPRMPSMRPCRTRRGRTSCSIPVARTRGGWGGGSWRRARRDTLPSSCGWTCPWRLRCSGTAIEPRGSGALSASSWTRLRSSRRALRSFGARRTPRSGSRIGPSAGASSSGRAGTSGATPRRASGLAASARATRATRCHPPALRRPPQRGARGGRSASGHGSGTTRWRRRRMRGWRGWTGPTAEIASATSQRTCCSGGTSSSSRTSSPTSSLPMSSIGRSGAGERSTTANSASSWRAGSTSGSRTT
mmetsp:Transcript_21578/g.62036  ORF Transcript_21578/g.62036 Transcript_21578/m.62036 type:complete len:256 (-) Transcript_21578:262-1029(-)